MSNLLWYWHYRLKGRKNLNACIHPWPELGDPPLQKCLEDLAGARRWSIVRRALRCLEMDGAARSLKDPLFEELEVPLSHATLTGCDEDEVFQAVQAGFTAAKLKCGNSPSAEFAFLERMSTTHPGLRWRLDFNETGEVADLVDRFAVMPEAVKGRIDFLEDPCHFSGTTWRDLFRKTRVPLAVDRDAAPNCAEAQVMIVKPAIDEPWLLAEAAQGHGQRVVVTSYMDHPLGQAFAAWEAGRLELQFPGLLGMCGLQTHHLFEPDAFTEALGSWTPEFHAPPGTGLGFDDLLEALPWKRVP
jgi:O-succinylbenzoate synthase